MRRYNEAACVAAGMDGCMHKSFQVGRRRLTISKLMFKSVLRRPVAPMSFKPRVYFLKDRYSVGHSATRSVGKFEMEVPMGRTGYQTRH